MNIRTRCLAGIVPMFALLGIATGLLVFFLQYRETRWGLGEQAAGLAVTIAEFMDTGTLDRLAKDSLTDQDRRELLKPINRIADRSGPQRITIFDHTTDRPLVDIGPGAGEPFAAATPEDTRNTTVRFRAAVNNRPAAMLATTSIGPVTHGARYTLTVQTTADPLIRLRAGLLHDLAVYLLTALITGTLCALLIALILMRAIRELAQAAEQAAAGNYDIQQQRSGAIREINDLWNTFQTAVSVLRGTLISSRRQLLDTELLRTERDLVKTLHETTPPPDCLAYGDFKWVVAPVRCDLPDTVADLFVQNDTLYAVAGSAGAAGSELRTAITASALLDYLRRRLKTASPAVALDHLHRIFDITTMRIIVYSQASNSLTTYVWQRNKRHFEETLLDLPMRPVVFHDVDSDLAEQLDIYVNTFSDSSCEELARNILTIIRDRDHAPHGAITVIEPLHQTRLDDQ